MTNINQYWNERDKRSARRAGLLLTAVAGALTGTIIGCFNNTDQKQKVKDPLEEITFISGVPGMPVMSLDYYAGSNNLGFPLRGPSGEYLCTYNGSSKHGAVVINSVVTAIMDAHEDKQEMLVSGKLSEKNHLKIYKISHPDFGTFVLQNFPREHTLK